MSRTTDLALVALDGLPADDWQPEHWDTLEAIRRDLAAETRAARRRLDASDAKRERVGKATRRQRKPPELIAGEAAATVRSRGRCEHPSGCTDTATVHHHRAGRTRHGAEYLMHLCEHHHRHVHANPEESYAVGAMLHRHAVSFDDPLGWAS